MKTKLTLVQNAEINRQRWDEKLLAQAHPYPYSLSWYLDAVCPNWHAIVNDDYSVMLPLPVKKRFGFRYLVQPLLSQQLTWLGYSEENTKEVEAIILKNFSWARFNVQAVSLFGSLSQRTNYELHTLSSPEKIPEAYSSQIKRHLRKFQPERLVFGCDNSIERLLEHRKGAGHPIGYEAGLEDQKILKILADAAFHNSAGALHYCLQDMRCIATAFIVKSGSREVLISSTRSEEGALSLLLDHLLRMPGKNDRVFDFEGSEIPGLARYYKGFGATAKPYYRLEIEPDTIPLRYFYRKKTGL